MKFLRSGNVSFDSVWKINNNLPPQANKQTNKQTTQLPSPPPQKKKPNRKTHTSDFKLLIYLVHTTATKPKMKLQKKGEQLNTKTASRVCLNSWSELKEINLYTKADLSLATIFRKEKAQSREEFCISNCFWGKRHIYTDNRHLASCPWPYVSSRGASSLVSILK